MFEEPQTIRDWRFERIKGSHRGKLFKYVVVTDPLPTIGSLPCVVVRIDSFHDSVASLHRGQRYTYFVRDVAGKCSINNISVGIVRIDRHWWIVARYHRDNFVFKDLGPFRSLKQAIPVLMLAKD